METGSINNDLEVAGEYATKLFANYVDKIQVASNNIVKATAGGGKLDNSLVQALIDVGNQAKMANAIVIAQTALEIIMAELTADRPDMDKVAQEIISWREALVDLGEQD